VLRWLLGIVLTALALRRLAGDRRQEKPAPRPPFAPDPPVDRANSRAADDLSPYAIEDAEYEELPGSGR
jgi:hypothetical protein